MSYIFVYVQQFMVILYMQSLCEEHYWVRSGDRGNRQTGRGFDWKDRDDNRE